MGGGREEQGPGGPGAPETRAAAIIQGRLQATRRLHATDLLGFYADMSNF